MGFWCLVLKECFKKKGQKEREFFGWTDGHAREQKRQAFGNTIFYLILLKATAELRVDVFHYNVYLQSV